MAPFGRAEARSAAPSQNEAIEAAFTDLAELASVLAGRSVAELLKGRTPPTVAVYSTPQEILVGEVSLAHEDREISVTSTVITLPRELTVVSAKLSRSTGRSTDVATLVLTCGPQQFSIVSSLAEVLSARSALQSAAGGGLVRQSLAR
ncbi:MAG: hypothetical protein ACTHNT_11535 [Actinomycetales bacterium]